MNICIDLHCHSSFSDGALSPEQLAMKFSSAGIQLTALTDHETTKGLKAFQSAMNHFNIQTITGVEISTRHKGSELHLLAYGFDPENRELQNMLSFIRYPFLVSIQKVYNQIRGLSFGQPPVYSGGYVADVDYVIDIIHQAGGISVLAHPFEWVSEIIQLKQGIRELKDIGLDGLEVFYKPYNKKQQMVLFEIADSNNLIPTTGSDYHGQGLAPDISPGINVPKEKIRKLLMTLNIDLP